MMKMMNVNKNGYVRNFQLFRQILLKFLINFYLIILFNINFKMIKIVNEIK